MKTWTVMAAAGLLAIASAAVVWGQSSGAAGTPAAPAPSATTQRVHMSTGQAAVLGVVEGLTEYLPVSSTGHLILAQRAMGIGTGSATDKEAADAYAICIQAGAILAVLGLYFGRVKQAFRGIAGKDAEGRKLAINITLGFLPAAVIGLAVHKYIEQYLMGGAWGLWPIIAAWFVGGVAILAVSWWRRAHDEGPRYGRPMSELTAVAALIIGFAQCLAMWPGVSRSLVTIVGGVMVGLSLPAAVEFSFLLGVVTLTAATAYDGLKHGHVMLHAYGPLPLAVGLIAALISAMLAVKWMVAYLNRHGLSIFGYYRVALGVLIGVLVVMKVL